PAPRLRTARPLARAPRLYAEKAQRLSRPKPRSPCGIRDQRFTRARLCGATGCDGNVFPTMVGWMFRALHRISTAYLGWPRTPEEERQALLIQEELRQEKGPLPSRGGDEGPNRLPKLRGIHLGPSLRLYVAPQTDPLPRLDATSQ